MAACAGLDWGTAKIAAAVWNEFEQAHRVVRVNGAPFTDSAVGVRKPRNRGEHTAAVYPLTTGWPADGPDLRFDELKQKSSILEPELLRYLMAPVFKFWFQELSSGAVNLSVATPALITVDRAGVLRDCAQGAGFQFCATVSEVLAAVLAYLPVWQKDDLKWRRLEAGRCVWVADCGAKHLYLALVHVKRSPGAPDHFDFRYLGADCVEYAGSLHPEAHRPVADLVQEACRSIMRAARVASEGHKELAKAVDAAEWMIGSGGGPNLAPATKALGEQLTRVGMMPRLCQEIPPPETVAAGAAVHAAMQAGILPYQVRREDRPLILGVRTASGPTSFLPLSQHPQEPGSTVHRAFQLPGDIDAEVEVTVGAALPGGDHFGVLQTFLLRPERFQGVESPRLLVESRMENWKKSIVTIRGVWNGESLYSSSLPLP